MVLNAKNFIVFVLFEFCVDFDSEFCLVSAMHSKINL